MRTLSQESIVAENKSFFNLKDMRLEKVLYPFFLGGGSEKVVQILEFQLFPLVLGSRTDKLLKQLQFWIRICLSFLTENPDFRTLLEMFSCLAFLETSVGFRISG